VVPVDLNFASGVHRFGARGRYRGKFLAVARRVDATDSASVLKFGATGIVLESDASMRLIQAMRLVAGEKRGSIRAAVAG
jgi:hypothetical protein